MNFGIRVLYAFLIRTKIFDNFVCFQKVRVLYKHVLIPISTFVKKKFFLITYSISFTLEIEKYLKIKPETDVYLSAK